MKKNSFNKIEKIIDKELEREAVIFGTDEGMHIQGTGADVLSLVCMIVKKLSETGMPKEMIQRCFDLGTKSEEELYQELSKSLEKVIKKGGEDSEPSSSNRETE